MKEQKMINIISVIFTLLAIIITVLFMNGEKIGLTKVLDADAEGTEEASSEYFSKNDLNGNWDVSGATKITLDGTKIKIKGSGAYEYNGDVVISQSGWYVLNGTLDDGSIKVDADKSSKVWILLDDAEICASDDAALRIDQADKVFLTLAEGSKNKLECGDEMSDEAEEDGTNGVIFAHDDLTINGSGSLSIVSDYEHGIKAKDSLKICGGTISIKAISDGIHVNDHFRMTAADVTIDAMDDGICSEGDLLIASGKLLISDCYEGLECPQITVLDGDIEIYPDDDGFNANGGEGGFGNFGFFSKTEDSEETEEEAADPCVTIYGGNIKIFNPDAKDADGIDSNKDIYIYGGNIFISLPGGGPNNGIDFGSESGGVCEIHGGTVISCGGASMVEQFDATSTQASLLYNLSNSTEDDVRVCLTDENGNAIIDTVIPTGFDSIQLSCPEMKTGATYTLKIGDKEEEITLDSVSTSVGGISGFGNFGGGKTGFPGMSERTDMSEMPEMPDGAEMPEERERPDMSEMPEGFEAPDGMERPGMPGMSGRPDFSDKGPGMRGDIRNADFGNEEDENVAGSTFQKTAEISFERTVKETEKEEVVSNAKNLNEYDSSVWKYLAASVIVLAAALVSTKLFRRW